MKDMTDKYFDARSLAEALGQSTGHHDWHAWLDQIPDEQIDFVRGKLVMHFGRLNSPFLPNNGIDYVREHVRNLELQLSQWLDSPEALIDHFAISKISARKECWWWTDEHTKYWKTRGKDVDKMPFSISLIPLCGCAAFSEFDARFNAPVRQEFCAKLFEMMPSERESLLECIESVCVFLNIAEIEELAELSNLLRSQRVNQLLAPYVEIAPNPLLIKLSHDIEKMSSKDYHLLFPAIENQVRSIFSAINNSKEVAKIQSSDSHIDLWREQD